MTEQELHPLLAAHGLLPESGQIVARPPISKAERRVVARLKKRYAVELANAKAARIDTLNMTRGVDRRPIIQELLKDGHNAPALVLTFNDEHLVLLWAWRDAIEGRGLSSLPKQGRGSSSQRKKRRGADADSE
jgi:hypothetical protein